MFTGIVTHTTKVLGAQKNNGGLLLTLDRPPEWSDLEPGESIATEGVCLTIETVNETDYTCQIMPETLNRTSFGKLVPKEVNLERSLQAGDRFGGHFVQGHVDEVGFVTGLTASDDARLTISFGPKYQDLVVDKGSITVNGVSLTIADVAKDSCTVALIPYTLSHTTLGKLKVSSPVNLEFDLIGKYVVKAQKSHAKD